MGIDGLGLMIGAELVLDENRTRRKTCATASRKSLSTMDCSFWARAKIILRFCTALMIDRPAVQEGLERFERSLTQAEQEAGLL